MTTPAGWHKDPENPARLRYFDGNEWTEQTKSLRPTQNWEEPEAVTQWVDGGLSAAAEDFSAPAGEFTQQSAPPQSSGVVAQLKFSDARKFATKKLNQNPFPIIGLSVVWFSLLFILFMAQVYISLRILFASLFSFTPTSNTSLTMVLSYFAMVVLGLGTFAVSAGLLRGGLAATSGKEPVSWRMVFHTRHLGRFIGVLAIVIPIGYLLNTLLIIPGLVFYVFTAYAPVIALDQGMNSFRAIYESFRLVKRHFWHVLWITTLCYLFTVSGILLCVPGLILTALLDSPVLAGIIPGLLGALGLILTVPLGALAFVYSYRAINGESIAVRRERTRRTS